MNAKLFLKKHSATILSCISIAGVVITTVTAIRATPKALELIHEKEDELGVEKLTAGETIKATWKCYIPTALIGMSTISCIIGANILT